MKKVLIGIPVRDRAWILPEYLDKIRSLDLTDVEVYYVFIVDHSTDNTLTILESKTKNWENCSIIVWAGDEIPADSPKHDHKHRQECGIYSRLKELREIIRLKAVELGVDYLFSVDSDVLVEPDCLQRLLAHELDFVYPTSVDSQSEGVVTAWRLKGDPNNPWSKVGLRWVRIKDAVGVIPVFYCGCAFLVSSKVLLECTYLFEPNNFERALDMPVNGEDLWFACSAERKSIPRFLDTDCRVRHVKSELLYQPKGKKNGKRLGSG